MHYSPQQKWNIKYYAKLRGVISIANAAVLKNTEVSVIEYNLPKFNRQGLLIKYDKKFLEWKPNNKRRNSGASN
jgi:hypothetical protein